jgi:hypothetical protein
MPRAIAILLALMPSLASANEPITEGRRITVNHGGACARTEDGRVACWQAGAAEVLPDLDHVIGIAATKGEVCAWTTAGAVECRGSLTWKPALAEVVELVGDSDSYSMCARRRTGAVVCWQHFMDPPARLADAPGVTGALAVAVSEHDACALDARGVVCWSLDTPRPKLTRVPGSAGATALFGGHETFVALRPGKPPLAWHERTFAPQALPALPADVRRIALGDRTCALGSELRCWDLGSKRAPDVIALPDAADVAVGAFGACAHARGRVACWGVDQPTEPISLETPVEVAGLTDAVQLWAGVNSERTFALRANHRVVTWGRARTHTDTSPVEADDQTWSPSERARRSWSGSHQRATWSCGGAKRVRCTVSYIERDQTTSEGPADLGNLDGARDLRMPSNTSSSMCVADAAGKVSCFSPWDTPPKPAVVAGVTDAIQLAPYGEETCALERAGGVVCWDPDRLGQGERARRVPGVADAVELVGSGIHACVRHRTGKVSCWGFRSVLGDGLDLHQNTPVPVAGVAM